ncbi:MAG: pyruvate ferredoxin oxidoreductase [Anaerolineae bacterium]|nr:pyruvate ferredoxin oxidoreductase [Anaerolineae bacterium]
MVTQTETPTRLTLRELAKKPDRLTSGHRMCPGCAAPLVVKQVLMAIDEPVVVVCATGCLEVATTIFPQTAWNVPFIHNAFENAAATASGVEAAYRSLVRQGKIEDDNTRIVVFGGDGSSYDIGLQSLSGAMERGHRLLYVCYDNNAYMNTGIQRSSATPVGANTTTSPVGKVQAGKKGARKDLTAIMAAHGIPYVAQASPHNWRDLMQKVRKATAIDGPSFINVLASCNRGWRHDPADTIEIQRLGVDSCLWPLYEVEDGVYRVTYRPKVKVPVSDYLASQGRFGHLLQPANQYIIEALQADVDRRWERLLRMAGEV